MAWYYPSNFLDSLREHKLDSANKTQAPLSSQTVIITKVITPSVINDTLVGAE